MAQVFSRAADTYLRFALLGGAILVLGLMLVGGGLVRSSYLTRQDLQLDQPVPFSHRHHAGQLGIDCRYCHDTVEYAASAGYPPTHTCMTCHSQLWTNADALAPVRASLANGTPIAWNRVHDLPDFVYFNHSIHVKKGVGCETCHGRVDRMPLMLQRNSLQMEWCLNCHRDPAQFLRPRDEIVTMGYRPAGDQREIGERLMKEYKVADVRHLTSCSVCHR